MPPLAINHGSREDARSLRRAQPWVLAVAGACAVLSGAAWVAPAVALPPVVAYAVAFLMVALSALAAGYSAPLWTAAESLPLVTLLLLLLFAVPTDGASLPAAVAITALVLAAGSLLGTTIGAAIDRPGHLLAVACMSAVADLWSVFDGAAPSAMLAASIVEAGPGALSRWVLPWPMLGTSSIDPMLGAGDVVFIGLYLGAARAHMLSVPRVAGALMASAAAALVLVVVLAQPLPLLPLMAPAVVLVEPRARQLEGRDLRVLVTVMLGLLALLLVRWLG